MPVTSESPIQSRAFIDIDATVQAKIISDFTAVLAILGCNTVNICQCIGKVTTEMSSQLYGKTTRKNLVSARTLASYSPTTASFCDNAKRARYQAYVYKHAVDQDPQF